MEIVALVLVPIAAIALGFGIAYAVSRREPPPREDLLVSARAEHEERLRAARSQALEIRAEAEAVARQTLTSLEEVEQRMVRREERLDSRLDGLSSRETGLAQREASQAERLAAAEEHYAEQAAAIESIRALTPAEARRTLLERVAPSARERATSRAESVLEEAEVTFARLRARPAALAVQRTASELVGEFALVPVPIPREEIKGRIIGREGRNIKAFESMTGVELVIDDAPDVVTLSGFDPFRREVARLALLDLVEDGRIHPGRVEDAVKRARENLERQLRDDGQHAAETAGAGHVSNELADLLGRLQLFRVDQENALEMSVRLANVAAAMAGELRADARIVRRAAVLSGIGRAAGPEAGGSTDAITADILARASETPSVISALRTPDELYGTVTAEQACLWLARALVDTWHPARDESPVRRVDAVERAAAIVPGVGEALAFQVGTRVRLLVRPSEQIDTIGRIQLARAVLEKIDSSLGPRVGLTLAFLVGRQRHRGEGPQGNGTARVDGGRHEPRRRPSRRS
ncbi:MAG: Rnase Y domain-containing protein [Chloroflexota bacterium]